MSGTGSLGMGGRARIYLKHTESSVVIAEMVDIAGGSSAGSGGDQRSEAALLTHPWDLHELIRGDPVNRFS